MSTPRQVKGVNSKYRAMRRAQAHRAYWRHQNKYYLEQGYHLLNSVIQYLGKEIQRAASTASGLLLVEKSSRLVVGTGEGMGKRCL